MSERRVITPWSAARARHMAEITTNADRAGRLKQIVIQTINMPSELEVVCPSCDAVLAYSKIDVHKHDDSDTFFVECEVCGNEIPVEPWKSRPHR